LEKENGRLKKLLAEVMLDNQILKDIRISERRVCQLIGHFMRFRCTALHQLCDRAKARNYSKKVQLACFTP